VGFESFEEVKDVTEAVTEAEAAQQEVKEELDTFVPIEYITGMDGSTYKLPKVSWKKEKEIFGLVGILFDHVKETHHIDFENITMTEIMGLMGTFLRVAPATVEQIVAIITDLEPQVIDENLDSEEILKLLVPFFSGKVEMFQNVMRGTMFGS
jgi:hypothetical protein